MEQLAEGIHLVEVVLVEHDLKIYFLSLVELDSEVALDE